MNVIDTRDLLEELKDLKVQILEEFNGRFNTELEDFEEIETFLNDESSFDIDDEERTEYNEYIADEYNSIREIEELQDYIGEDYFRDGVILVERYDFEEYCEEEVEQCYNMKDIPQFIRNNIDWKGIANDMEYDYTNVDFRGGDYLYRV